MRNPLAELVNSETLRTLAESLGPYCLAAAILPGGMVLVPLLFLFRRHKRALHAALLRTSTAFNPA